MEIPIRQFHQAMRIKRMKDSERSRVMQILELRTKGNRAATQIWTYLRRNMSKQPTELQLTLRMSALCESPLKTASFMSDLHKIA